MPSKTELNKTTQSLAGAARYWKAMYKHQLERNKILQWHLARRGLHGWLRRVWGWSMATLPDLPEEEA